MEYWSNLFNCVISTATLNSSAEMNHAVQLETTYGATEDCAAHLSLHYVTPLKHSKYK